MKVLGLITEYNPFHYGHKYHLNQSILQTKATHSVAIMSSSFVQRGEPSIVDKWTKAKMAINNGIDLVIELPFVYSTQSAELFAFSAVNIMNSLNTVDYISFGSEIGDLEPLINIAEVLLEEPSEYKETLKESLNKGLSFPTSRSIAVYNYLQNQNYKNLFNYRSLLKESNNILAIEYLKSLKKLKSSIKPITILRKGSSYKDKDLDSKFSSATGIRYSILNNGLYSVRDLVPKETFNSLLEYENNYKRFNRLENYENILLYLLLTNTPLDLLDYFDVKEGLENRIIKNAQLYKDVYQLIESISTKRYPKTRIQRILIHLLLNLKEKSIKELIYSHPPYIRVLGSNQKGYEILNKIRRNSNVPIIQKFSEYKKSNNTKMKKLVSFEEKATDIYFLGLRLDRPLVNMDYKISQYNKK